MKAHLDQGISVREKVLQGVEVLSNFVSATLGPKGQNVLIQKEGKLPFVTKDGVTVADSMSFEDPFVNAGAQVVKQVSARTNAEAGDGTTTSTVLAHSLLKNAHTHIITGASSPIDIKRGLETCLQSFLEEMDSFSKPISNLTDVEHIATISSNNDKFIGNMVATAVDKVGKGGSITIEESRSLDTVLDLVEGFRFDSGYLATAFVTDDRRKVVKYDNPMFLVTDSKIDSVEQILPALEIAAREGRPFVIVADDVEGQALAALIMNTVRGTMKVSAVKAPGYGSERRAILDDLATSTGARFFRKENGDDIKKISLLDFGSSQSVEIEKNNTTIVDGNGDTDAILNKIEDLKQAAKDAASLSDAEVLVSRAIRLSSGVAIIRVGASSEVEAIEKKHRVEDALEAVRAAQVSGISPGGGVTLLRISERINPKFENKQQEVAQQIFCKALQEPFKKMAKNSGFSHDVLIPKVLESENDFSGFDFYRGEQVDMYDAGIVDPSRVTTCAVRNAVSAVSTLLLTNHAIVEV